MKFGPSRVFHPHEDEVTSSSPSRGIQTRVEVGSKKQHGASAAPIGVGGGMARVLDNWERLVRATLKREQLRTAGQGHERTPSGIAGAVPASLAQTTNIDAILQAADEIQSEDPNVARILCEQAYSMAQNLDPNSDGRGVLQFKTGLMSVIKQKLAKKDGGRIDRNRDIENLWEFYQRYKRHYRVDDIQREEQRLQESGTFSSNLGELELRSSKMKKVIATLRALVEVMEALSKDADPEGVGGLIMEELRKIRRSGAALAAELTPYNIVPLEAPSLTNLIRIFPEVKGAISAIKYTEQFPRLPAGFVSGPRDADMFDLLEFVFGFQKDNIRNQRENVVLMIANAQSRLGIPAETDPKIDEKAINEVFLKVLDNYIKWCRYLRIRLAWNSLEAINRDRKLFLVSLYFVIWGEAANVRFLPECICYIFHHMAKELDAILDHGEASPAASCTNSGSVSFLEQIICPIYETLSEEAARNNNGKAAHSAWRNYDDFNEYFCAMEQSAEVHGCILITASSVVYSHYLITSFPPLLFKCGLQTGKSSFVEHRTFLHLYRSFHRLWIFLALMFQALTIIAFNDGRINLDTFKSVLSIGPSFAIMNFIKICLDVLLTFGAYTTARGMAISRIVIQFFWGGLSSVFVTYLYLKVLQERNDRSSDNSLYFRIYILVLGVYAGLRLFLALMLKFPACHRLSEMSDQSFFQFFKWIYQERYFVGRGLYEKMSDYCRSFDLVTMIYMLVNLVLLFACMWLSGWSYLPANSLLHTFSRQAIVFFLGIRPLVSPTNIIVDLPSLAYSWHDLISKKNNNFLTVVSLWAPVVAIYLMDIHIWYTILSAIVGGIIGARARLGEIRSIEMVHKRFESFPEAFVNHMISPQTKRCVKQIEVCKVSKAHSLLDLKKCQRRFEACAWLNPLHLKLQDILGLGIRMWLVFVQESQDNNKAYAAMFAPFWNEIVKSLREEDFISNREMDLLSIPSNTGSLRLVQWPLFLLSSKILLAIDLALDCKDTQADLWNRICRDEYMAYAVQECYYSIEKILYSLVDGEGRLWVERIFREINNSILEGSLVITLSLKKLPLVLSRFTALTGLLIRNDPELSKGAAKAVYELYEVVTHDLLSSDLREQLDTWNILARARNEGRLFSRIQWPNDPEIKELVKRLHLLLTVKDSAANVPKNLEARRRLEFFTNSLFMDMPPAKPVSEMMPFSVFTPYYSETVLYSTSELQKENEDGISIIFYLQKIFPDEWDNFLERIGRSVSTGDAELQESSSDSLELRFWASYRGQTLARTVRGMMYYRRALMLQSYMERRSLGVDDYSQNNFTSQGFELSRESRAQADLKFTYVVSCQIYGQQKQRKAPEAADISLLLQRNEALRVAFIHVEESGATDGKISRQFYSKLVKADINGKDQEIYSIKLPGDPKLGEGKPENQNHAIIFTRGDAVQTIDMNQDNYLEEAIKMRNLLEEFHGNHGVRPPTILGVREHVFTGSVSSLAWFMSNQETSFVTLGQRVLANPLKVRMHYGHPDVFDRIFHITRGGISKASRVINISEDIYSGFNSTLRQGNITHHEYIQVGKGRDVGLNQIALFEGKVAGGNGEQVLSRDVYRLGQLFDFFRMLSFFFTTVGYYVCTMMTVLTVYIFLYGRVYLAFSGLDEGISKEARTLGSTALDAALNAQFLVQIGVFTAIPMIMGFILELGLLKAVFSFITMQLQLCSVFFTFSLGTRTHYFGRTILHGGAKYRATGRGFVVRHIKFAENYRLYSRSHFVKALEVALLLIVYIAYGYTRGGAVSFVLLTLSSWFLAISWLFAPYIFNPSGFEWQKTVEDFDDWTSWLLYKGGVGVKGDNSWESWWDEEQMHIQTLRGRILETILSLRFFLFQYGIVYKLHLTGKDTSLAVYGFSWVILVGIVLIFKIFTYSPKKSADFKLVMRFTQGVAALGLVAAVCLVIAFTNLSIPDLFASILAFIPTGWAILSLAITWKRIVWSLGLWDSVREFARMYDAGMGGIIFAPIAFLSWFPFISTFQSRLLFNQAFSRGLEISLILAGNKANVET
ncbi:callose synthase 10 [Senna tora]|uniref:1,3-beta-glucan synthase n=1 Tax=Senna tora TaxID=362788 RepID=A0A834X5M9_9FABA|nr:callose synthase 10 [Senna tora]